MIIIILSGADGDRLLEGTGTIISTNSHTQMMLGG